MLGDGYLRKPSTLSSLYKQGFARRHKDWAFQIQRDLIKYNISSRISDYDNYDKRRNKTYLGSELWTLSYTGLKDERERWYLNGIKIVPKDLKLEAPTIANWYMGDGSLMKGSTYTIQFSTDSFSDSDREYLIQLLEQLGYHPYPSGRRIKLHRKKEINSLLRSIISFQVPSFKYKWRCL